MKKTILLISKNIRLTKLILADKTPVLFDENNNPTLEVVFDERPILTQKVVSSSEQFNHLRQTLVSSGMQVIVKPQETEAEDWLQLDFKGQTKTIRPQLTYSLWQSPEFTPDFLYISSSVWLADQDISQICEYLTANPAVKMIVEDSLSEGLLKQADLAIYQISSNDDNLAQNKFRITKAHQTPRTVVIGRDKIWVSDNNQIVKTSFKLGFPVFEIYGIFIKSLDFNGDAEDQLALFSQLMSRIETGQNINFDNLNDLKLDASEVELVSGKINYQKSLASTKRQFLSNVYPLLDLDIFGPGHPNLSSTNFVKLIKLLVASPGLEHKISSLVLGPLAQDCLDCFKADPTILIGVRLDTGFEPMPGFADDKITVGLDSLTRRLTNFREAGVRLAKWRCQYQLNTDSPSDASILSNSHMATRFAKLAQENGLLPIVALQFDSSDIMKTNRIIESLMAEMRLFKVDTDNLVISFASLNNQPISYSNQLTLPQAVTVMSYDNVSLNQTDKRAFQALVRELFNRAASLNSDQDLERLVKDLISQLSGLV